MTPQLINDESYKHAHGRNKRKKGKTNYGILLSGLSFLKVVSSPFGFICSERLRIKYDENNFTQSLMSDTQGLQWMLLHFSVHILQNVN